MILFGREFGWTPETTAKLTLTGAIALIEGLEHIQRESKKHKGADTWMTASELQQLAGP